MTELEKYELVNKAESTEELQKAIQAIGGSTGLITGRTKDFQVEKQIENVPRVVLGYYPARTLTRSYGIRQQALYLAYYNK